MTHWAQTMAGRFLHAFADKNGLIALCGVDRSQAVAYRYLLERNGVRRHCESCKDIKQLMRKRA